MTVWNQLLAKLDTTFAFANKVTSTVKKMQQGFDNRTQEHVIWLEYRIKVGNPTPPTPNPQIFGNEQKKRDQDKRIGALIDEVLRDLRKKRDRT